MWSGTTTLDYGFFFILKKMSPQLSQLNVAMVHRNYFRQNILRILKLATYTKIEDHYSRCTLATFGKDCQNNVHILFCLHKTSSFTEL